MVLKFLQLVTVESTPQQCIPCLIHENTMRVFLYLHISYMLYFTKLAVFECLEDRESKGLMINNGHKPALINPNNTQYMT